MKVSYHNFALKGPLAQLPQKPHFSSNPVTETRDDTWQTTRLDEHGMSTGENAFTPTCKDNFAIQGYIYLPHLEDCGLLKAGHLGEMPLLHSPKTTIQQLCVICSFFLLKVSSVGTSLANEVQIMAACLPLGKADRRCPSPTVNQ